MYFGFVPEFYGKVFDVSSLQIQLITYASCTVNERERCVHAVAVGRAEEARTTRTHAAQDSGMRTTSE
jgi:hypothetical protein